MAHVLVGRPSGSLGRRRRPRPFWTDLRAARIAASAATSRSNRTLDDALKDEPPPEWTRRPNAKDDIRAHARKLRAQGLDYEEIAGALGVAKSSVSLWVRDLPIPQRLSYEECRR